MIAAFLAAVWIFVVPAWAGQKASQPAGEKVTLVLGRKVLRQLPNGGLAVGDAVEIKLEIECIKQP